jgi:hypothetical protein
MDTYPLFVPSRDERRSLVCDVVFEHGAAIMIDPNHGNDRFPLLSQS